MHISRLLLTATAVILCPFAALADTTYVYTGSNFISATGAYTTSDSIQGSFTVSTPLADNLTTDTISPESFSFTDGVQTLSSSTSGISDTFQVSTDASGNIVDWSVSLLSGDGFIDTINGLFDEGTTDTSDAGFTFTPGSWSVASPVPEPSTLALLGSGALGLIAPIRRRLA